MWDLETDLFTVPGHFFQFFIFIVMRYDHNYCFWCHNFEIMLHLISEIFHYIFYTLVLPLYYFINYLKMRAKVAEYGVKECALKSVNCEHGVLDRSILNAFVNELD